MLRNGGPNQSRPDDSNRVAPDQFGSSARLTNDCMFSWHAVKRWHYILEWVVPLLVGLILAAFITMFISIEHGEDPLTILKEIAHFLTIR
jgi:hypothetical protein